MNPWAVLFSLALPLAAAEVPGPSAVSSPSSVQAVGSFRAFLASPAPDVRTLEPLLSRLGDPSLASELPELEAAALRFLDEPQPEEPLARQASDAKLAMLGQPLIWAHLGAAREEVRRRREGLSGRRLQAARSLIERTWRQWETPASEPVGGYALPATADVPTGVSPTQLRLYGLPTTAPRPDMTLRELQDWRRSALFDAVRSVRRELIEEPTAQLPWPFDSLARALRAHSWLTPVPMTVTRFYDRAIFGVAVAAWAGAAAKLGLGFEGGSWEAARLLAWMAAGLIGADALIWLGHREADDFLVKHRPGRSPSPGTWAWLHHAIPIDIVLIEPLRAIKLYVPFALGAGVLGLLSPYPAATAFLLGFAVVAFVGQLFHRAAHMSDPGRFMRLLQALGVAVSREYHGLHHWGDKSRLLPGEEPVRNVGYYHLYLGYLSPVRWLDWISGSDRLNRLQHRLTGRDPQEWEEYPHLKLIWTAPRRWRTRLALIGRILRYRATMRWHEEELAAAERTLASPLPGTELEHARARHAELAALLGRMREGMASLRARLDALDRP